MSPEPDPAASGPTPTVWTDLTVPALYEHVLRRGEAELAATGAIVAETGQHTGRSPKDKFIVSGNESGTDIWWAGNQPIAREGYERLCSRLADYCGAHDLYVQNVYACADPGRHLKVRIITELAWHSLFARNLFIVPSTEELRTFQPDFTVLCAPGLEAKVPDDGTRTGTFIVLSLADRTVIIGGTRYAGEIKKSVFTVLNYMMPKTGVLPMHCSANYSKTTGNAALFFGLSGTGKTTLSSDPTRTLIGDDEHGWGSDGVFNFEGGCYAKTIRISQTAEPEIYAATERFGTVLENVVIDPDTRLPDYDSDAKTENTRAAYAIEAIPSADVAGLAGHPSQILFLSADAFGVLPPVARLDPDQVRYFFLCGYTAKVAGTERGVTEPEPTFSACFAQPFLLLPPEHYAEMLLERIAKHRTRVWMLNTGWVGGSYGVGHRISIAHTRAIVRAIVEGKLDDMPTLTEAAFGLHIPTRVPGVPTEILAARGLWSDPAQYDRQAARLTAMFGERHSNFFRDTPRR